MTSRFSQFMIGLTLVILAIHTAITVRVPDSLGPTRAMIRFETVPGESFTEASPHILPRITVSTAVLREAPRERCFITASTSHAHVYCADELDAGPKPVGRPPERQDVHRASLPTG